MTSGFRRFETIPTIMTIGAFALMMSLGVWQLQRLEWKEALIARADAARQMETLTALPKGGDASSLEFRSATLRGTFLSDHEFHLTPRYKHEKFGYHILTPLKLKDGRLILVNRGWVPAEKKDPKTRPETLSKGAATVSGILRAPQPERWFMMKNDPAKNMWFWQDMNSFSAMTGASLEPVVLEVTGAEQAGVLPVPSDGSVEFRNDHLGYALTWFAIAAGVLIIFVMYHRRRV